LLENLKNLPNDIYKLLDPDNHHEVNEDNLEAFASSLKDVIRSRLKKQEERGNGLRFSALGKPDRQVWFDAHPEPGSKEPMPPKTYLKFLYGDVLEAVLLLLTKEAGYEVTDEQREVEVDGVKGHIDARIAGTIVDVKSASSYGYKKFEQRNVVNDDPFGYVAQLSGYADVLTPNEDAAWLAIDKVSGDICVSPLSKFVIDDHKPEHRIDHLKKVIASEEIPPLCHEPIPDGRSGNMCLPTPCSYCAHKYRCHPDVRVFLYSNGPKFLTTVAKVPNVPEVTREGKIVGN
jgi:hypothetical protein